jgi:hypothetical protein
VVPIVFEVQFKVTGGWSAREGRAPAEASNTERCWAVTSYVAELLNLVSRESGVDVHVEMGVAGEPDGFVGIVGHPFNQILFG